MNDFNETFTAKELIFFFFSFIGIMLYRFLGWIMPKTAEIFFNHVKKILTKDIEEKLQELEEKFAKNHALKNEFNEVLRAVLDNDKESLDAIREFYAKKHK